MKNLIRSTLLASSIMPFLTIPALSKNIDNPLKEINAKIFSCIQGRMNNTTSYTISEEDIINNGISVRKIHKNIEEHITTPCLRKEGINALNSLSDEEQMRIRSMYPERIPFGVRCEDTELMNINGKGHVRYSCNNINTGEKIQIDLLLKTDSTRLK